MSLENFKNRKIEWDTVNKNFDQSVQVISGDVNSRTVTIVITDNGEPINLTGYSVKLVYKYIYNDNSGFVMLTPTDASKGEFSLTIPTEMTSPGSIKSNLILLNENLEQVIVSKSIKFISDDSTVTDLAQEVNSKIDDFTKLLLENMPQVMRSELNDLHAQTESNTINIDLKANLSDMTSLQSAMTSLQSKVEAFGITPENLVTIKSLLDAIANNASDSEVAELINSVNILTSNISLMSDGDYSPKANKTDLESLQSVVNNQSATISTKANKTDFDNLQTAVTSQGIVISTKAEQAEIIQARGGQSSLDVRLDGLDTKYTDLENKTTTQLAQTDTKLNRPKETKTLHLAHRGTENLALENTLLAFEYAGQMGFDGIEIDVQDSLDGSLYIMHDATVDRTTNGTGSISGMTNIQIDNLLVDSGAYISLYPNTKIPTLEQTLLVAKKWNMIVFMELKKISQTSSYQKIVDIIIQLNMIESVVVIGSIASVLEMKKIEPTIEYGCFLDSFSELENAKPLLPYAHVSLEKGQITKQGIADAHNMGFKVNAWTLNYNESDLSQTFKDYGIDYITGTVML